MRLENANRKLGTDKPLYEQYGRFVWRLAHLDLGVSYAGFDTKNERKVGEEIQAAAPISISVVIGGAFLLLVVALPLGTLAVDVASGEIGFDLPILTGVVLMVSITIIVLNLVLDLLYAWLDPRIRVN